MAVEMGIWRIDGGKPRKLNSAVMPSERQLEELLEQDPTLLGEPLLIIGRQVMTPYGKFIDLLAMDGDGHLHVLELKRDRTPRDVVAQALDYGSWCATLTTEDLVQIANEYLSVPFEEAFDDVFHTSRPDALNEELQLTIVASELDTSSERIVTYLREFGVPINAVFFSYLEEEERAYLARTWLAASEKTTAAQSGTGRKGKRTSWNGVDWFVSFGEGDYQPGRNWEDALRYGFVSAGGGVWYSRTLRNVPVGARINVYIPKQGYVGVGTVTGEPVRFDEATVDVDGRRAKLVEQPLTGGYNYGSVGAPDNDDDAEWLLPVEWIDARPKERALWRKGMFANQNSAGRLRQEFTLDLIAQEFRISPDQS